MELSPFIAANFEKESLAESCYEYSPESLVGREIHDVNSEERWYTGYVVSYNTPP